MPKFYDREFSSRLLIGSALYPSPAIMQGAIRASGAQIVTVSLRRESAGGKTGDAFWKLIRELDVTVLPNTAGCRTVREAVTTAKLARELFATSWIKLEVIADNDTLQPDVFGLVEAAILRARRADVIGLAHVADARVAKGSYDALGVVGRRVVHHDELPFDVRLREDAANGAADRVRAVARGRDERDVGNQEC